MNRGKGAAANPNPRTVNGLVRTLHLRMGWSYKFSVPEKEWHTRQTQQGVILPETSKVGGINHSDPKGCS